MNFQQLVSWDNLWFAYRRASKGKRGQANVAAFEYRLEENLGRLQKELQERSYQPGGYVSFTIHEPKKRRISAAPFRDRVVHHALCHLIEPIFERSFIFDNYANRLGKGTHRALDRCQFFARRYGYVLACDIQQFFPSIDHRILYQTLSAKIEDEGILWLIQLILKGGAGVLQEEYSMVYFSGDDLFAVNRPRGLPIGNLTSQFWANVYLNPFDHFVKRELGCQGYIRYVDDFLLFGDNKRVLWEWKGLIERRLEQFRLTIHPQAQSRQVGEGISFLGFRVFPQRRRLKRRKGIYFRRRFWAMVRAYEEGGDSLEAIGVRVKAWVNHVRYSNSVGLRKAVLSSVRIRSNGRSPS